MDRQREAFLAERGRVFSREESLTPDVRGAAVRAAAAEGDWIELDSTVWRQIQALPEEQREYVRIGQGLFQLTTLAGAGAAEGMGNR